MTYISYGHDVNIVLSTYISYGRPILSYFGHTFRTVLPWKSEVSGHSQSVTGGSGVGETGSPGQCGSAQTPSGPATSTHANTTVTTNRRGADITQVFPHTPPVESPKKLEPHNSHSNDKDNDKDNDNQHHSDGGINVGCL